jgi:hypothetical protein
VAYHPAFIIDAIGDKSPDATDVALEDMGILLWALVNIDSAKIRRYPDKFPPLYQSGIVYGEAGIVNCEGIDDNWIDIQTLYDIGRGTCKELAAARVAELRMRFNVDASPFVTMEPDDVGKDQFHVMVRWPDVSPPPQVLAAADASHVSLQRYPQPDGTIMQAYIECPSTVLGMGRI